MNDKERIIFKVLDIAISACEHSFAKITREDVIAKNGNEIVRMTRCIFVTELSFLGYTEDTMALLLDRSKQAISDILVRAHEYRKESWIYRVAEAEATNLCEQLRDQVENNK